MRIYTRGGDGGMTALIGGTRRPKHDARVEAYGSVDEAGAFVGFAMSQLQAERDADMLDVLAGVSQTMWDVGADLAAPEGAAYTFRTRDGAAGDLEPVIDRFKDEAQRVERFVVRGGSGAAAALHVACTVVRRAERRVVELMQTETVHAPALKYLNRLSDLLFVLARAANARDRRVDVEYANSSVVFRPTPRA